MKKQDTPEVLMQTLDPAMRTKLMQAFHAEEEAEQLELEKSLTAMMEMLDKKLEESDEDVMPANVYRTLNAMIEQLDRRISTQLSDIIHDENFQKLHASWLGLQKFVRESQTDSEVKIFVLNASKQELLEDLRDNELEQSALFSRVYTERIGMFKGEPYGVIIGDFEFGRGAADITLLKKMANIAAVAHAPFISAASPNLFKPEWRDFTLLNEVRALEEIFADDPQLAPWRSFRDMEDARYVGLVLPRVLMRLPYDKLNNPTHTFVFEEDVSGKDGTDHSKYLWGNAAYSLGIRITQAFHDYGWCVAIRGEKGGGLVEDLPIHTFKSDSRKDVIKCPAEVPIPYRRDKELSDLGFMGLLWGQNSDVAVFLSGQSCRNPKSYSDPMGTANANLSARLPYIFAVSRFAQYVQKILYREIGSLKSAEQLEADLRAWILQYSNSSDEGGERLMAERPLRDYQVTVTEMPDNPGSYDVKIDLQPRIVFEEAQVRLSLVAKVFDEQRG